MKCKRAKRRLSAFLDDELKEKEREGIKTHLKGCPSCARELEALSSSWDILLKLETVEPPAYLIQRTMAEIATGKGKIAWWQEIFLRPAPVLATILIGLLTGGFLGQSLYSNNSADDDEFASSICLDSFADFPQGSVGGVLLEEEV